MKIMCGHAKESTGGTYCKITGKLCYLITNGICTADTTNITVPETNLYLRNERK